MIAYLEGTVLERVGDEIVVVTRDALGGVGVGYRVTTCRVDVEATNPVALWIHSITNEFGTRLFGFATRDVRDRFLALIAIKGVGPKIARAIAAAGTDPKSVEALVRVRGVGRPTAEKIAEAFAS